MKKWFVFCLIGGLLCGPAVIWGADVTLDWQAVAGAAGYKIYSSNDLGLTWSVGRDVGNVLTITLTGVSEDRIVLFKGSAYKTGGAEEQIRNWSGAFYDHRKLPLLTPSRVSIP